MDRVRKRMWVWLACGNGSGVIGGVVVPEVYANRWTVGGNMGRGPNVNYTTWAKDMHFYNGDWPCNFSSSIMYRTLIYSVPLQIFSFNTLTWLNV